MDNIEIKKIEDLKDIDLSVVLQEDYFDAIKYYASELIDDLDWDGSIELAKVLDQKISGQHVDEQDKKNKVDILYFWVLKLKLFAFSTLPEREKIEVFKNDIVDIINFGLDINYAISLYLSVFDSPDIIINESKSFISGLLSSQKFLIPANDKFDKLNFKPTVSNWLKEYQLVSKSSKMEELEQGAFYTVKFFNSNQLVNGLSIQNKEALGSLIDIYNLLLKPISYEKVEKKQDGETFGLAAQKLVLPKDLQKSESAAKLPPQVPAPKNAPQVVPMEEVSSSPAAVMPPLTVKKQGSVQGYVMGAKNSNIQDLLKSSAQDYESRGLRMGSNPSSLIPNPLPKAQTNNPSSLNVNPLPGDAGIKKQNSKEQEINKKLEDLEKRIKK
jgi:hypothetical protein